MNLQRGDKHLIINKIVVPWVNLFLYEKRSWHCN